MGIYEEENKHYRIDLCKALWSKGNLTKMYRIAGITENLSSVDFIAEVEDKILLIEYKNPSIKDADNPDAFREDINKFYNKIIKKYYGSIFYLLASNKVKPVHYICILEAEFFTKSKLRKKAIYKIQKRLPFKLKENAEISDNIIVGFDILSIAEWNERYPMFPLVSTKA